MAYGRPRYSNHFELNKRKIIEEGASIKIVILYLQGTMKYFYSLICYGFKILPEGGRQSTEEYKLMHGVHHNDIILIQMMPTENFPVYVIKELIKNFSKNYIKIMFRHYKIPDIRY